MSDKVDNMRDLMSQLKLTFPNVMVTDTQQEFDLKVQDPSVTKFVKKGDIIYGFTNIYTTWNNYNNNNYL